MWPDQRYWLRSVLDGGHVEGSCIFDALVTVCSRGSCD